MVSLGIKFFSAQFSVPRRFITDLGPTLPTNTLVNAIATRLGVDPSLVVNVEAYNDTSQTTPNVAILSFVINSPQSTSVWFDYFMMVDLRQVLHLFDVISCVL